MRILYMGTPDFAVAPLRALVQAGHEICAVITQPDKPTGRGYKMTAPALKSAAAEMGLEVHQPDTLKAGALLPLLREKQPQLIAVAAYGKLLPEYILDFPSYGCINVHASLLPKYRGAAPINHAIINGETETGVTIMYMEKGLDTGDMLLWESTPIAEDDNAGTLHDRLSDMGGRLLTAAGAAAETCALTPVKQNDSLHTYAPMIQKADCHIDFSKSATAVRNQIRGLAPLPGAFTTLGGKLLKVYGGRVTDGDGPPGAVLYADRAHGLVIACGKDAVALTELKPEGKKKMSAAQYLTGHTLPPGCVAE